MIGVLSVFIVMFCIYQALTFLCMPCHENSWVKIKFSQFQQYYNLNPDRWTLYYDRVGVQTATRKIYGFTEPVYQFCYFGWLDYKKYKRFKKKIDKAIEQKRVNNINIQILEAVQQDINNLRKQANKEIEHGAKQSIDIQKRLEEDIKLKC